ncbi:MAG: hypothetical protein ACFE0I_06070 [Elainellaceae cyanobacterium]
MGFRDCQGKLEKTAEYWDVEDGMLKKSRAIALMTPILLSLPGFSTVTRAQTQRSEMETLHLNLQVAVCQNDWNRALQYINPMISSPQLTSRSRTELIQFRQQLQTWQSTGAIIANVPNCDEAIASSEASSNEEVEPSRSIDWQRVTQPYQQNARSSPAQAARSPANSTAQVNNNRQQCIQLGNIIGYADQQASTGFERANFSDINSLLTTMSQLALISDRAAGDLRGLSISDNQLRGFVTNFVSMYSDFSRSAREFVTAANSGNIWTLEASLAEMETMANRGAALANQVNSYCGWQVVTTYNRQ